ncbi:MAG TPA: D-glycero-beta-D-manno-heptose-7-phosphate kinase [Vicinamibacterales bacterium]|jgi:D-beta-D-heptose 7-phosphate kinase/D-beta-D-heptose 1-phosphate adenosyltransferase
MSQLTLPESGRLVSLVDAFAGTPILIVGDPMLDRFLVGDVTRISPEAPVPVVAFGREEHRLGGAANVAHNVAALGGAARFVGLVGTDEAAGRLSAALRDLGIEPDGLIADPHRCTTMKVRVVTSRGQQVARIDYESDAEASGAAEDDLLARAAAQLPGARAVLVSDYLKGTITKRLMVQLLELAREAGVPVLVDPKIPHLAYYRGARLVTPNQHEAETATHTRIRSHDHAREAARLFRERAGCEAAIITRGEHGMWISGPVEGALPASAREVADVTGAGDTVIATLALALASGGTLVEAAALASEAAGLVVAKFGPATVSRPELRDALARRSGSPEAL